MDRTNTRSGGCSATGFSEEIAVQWWCDWVRSVHIMGNNSQRNSFKKLLKNCVQFFGLCISLKLDFYLPYPLLLKVKIMLFKFNLGINRLS